MTGESRSPYYQFTDLTTRGGLKIKRLDTEKFHPAIRLAHVSTGVVTAPREVFDFCLVYFFAASGVCRVNGTDFPFNPRTLLVQPPFRPSHFEMDPSMPSKHIAVHFDICEGFPDRKPIHLREPYEVGLCSDLELPVGAIFPDKYPLSQTLLHLVEEWQREDTVSRLQANGLLSKVLLDACRFSKAAHNVGEHSRVRESVVMAVRYIERHFAKPLCPESISEAVGYSANYLCRMFRKEIGSSMMMFLTTVRMRHATELLRDQRYSVKEVSHMVGYANSRYFSRVFQEIRRVTPTQWRATKTESQTGGTK